MSARAYPRKFIEDAREARGDGAGGVVPDSGTLTLLLQDPFSLRRPNSGPISIPTNATLRFDLMIVNRNRQARLYGNFAVPVNSPAIDPPSNGTNLFESAALRGISNSGVLGLGTHTVSPGSDALSATPCQIPYERPKPGVSKFVVHIVLDDVERVVVRPRKCPDGHSQ